MKSLRNIVESTTDDYDTENRRNDNADDDFVFSDQRHQQQEFEKLSSSLANLGVLNKHLVDDVIADTHEQEQQQQRRGSSLEGTKPASALSSRDRRQSKLVAFQEGQKESFYRVLNEIEHIEQTQAQKGLSDFNFTFGLMNCFLIVYVFGAHPEHFWIVYILETVFWMTWKLNRMLHATPLCEVLYYLDFCWIMNISGVLLLLSFVVFANDTVDADANIIPVQLRKQLYLCAFGIACGPVFLACMALPFVAFLFHDVNTMANLIIHLTPSMAMFNFRWHAAALHAAYPTFFNTSYLRDMTASQEQAEIGSSISQEHHSSLGDLPFWNGFWGGPSVARNAMILYFAWWVPYTLWMILLGLKLPVTSKNSNVSPPKYDTVFHSLWRGGPCELVGIILWKRPKAVSQDQSLRNDFEVRDFMFYMIGHAIACTIIGIGIVGRICYLGCKTGHGIMLLLAIIICAERGAQRYTYYVTAMYGQKLRKAFQQLEEKQQQEPTSQQLNVIEEKGILEENCGKNETKKLN